MTYSIMNEAVSDGGDGGGGNSTEASGDAAIVAGAVQAQASTANPEEASSATETEGKQEAWYLAEGVEGVGDRPDFLSTKYKNAMEQAKGYKELESKFGSFTGAPDEYEVTVSEELKEQGLEFDADDNMIVEAKKFAQESGMNQEGFSKMLDLYSTVQLAENQALEQSKADEISSLGQGGEGRLKNIVAWGRANMDEQQFAGLESMIQTAGSVSAVERLIAMTRHSSVSAETASASGAASSEEVSKMQFEKDQYGNRRINTDKDFRARYEKMKIEAWGGEENRITIGG